jgi:hypothetical protein
METKNITPRLQSVRFEVFTAVKIKVVVFWVVMLCSVVVGYQHFRVKMEVKSSTKQWCPTAILHTVTTHKTLP